MKTVKRARARAREGTKKKRKASTIEQRDDERSRGEKRQAKRT